MGAITTISMLALLAIGFGKPLATIYHVVVFLNITIMRKITC
jgi:hypothetical protein